MRRIILVLLLLLAVPAMGHAQPVIHLEETAFSFGDIPEGPEVRHDFTVENRGTGDLRIERIQTSCGCTSSTIEKQLLRPGEKTVLTALYDTANRPGGFNKEIRIFSNDPKTPERVVVIDGVVKPKPMPMIGVEPAFMNIGKVRVGEERVLNVAISNMGEKELELYSISSRDGSVKLLDKEMRIAPGEKAQLELPFTRSNAGSFREVFLVMSNARRATVSLVVTGEAE